MNRRLYFSLFVVGVVLTGLVQAFQGGVGGSFLHKFKDPYPRIVNQVFYHIEKKYVEPERASPAKMLEGAFAALETSYPEIVVNLEKDGKSATVRVDETEKTFTLETVQDDFSRAADALNTILAFVEANLKSDVEKRDVYYFALNGALNKLDPHSNVFSPKHFNEFMISTRGSFGGIGFVFGIRDGDMSIIRLIEGTPAERGGLKSGDNILYIDGEPTINMPVDTAAGKMRGEPGTQVTLTIERKKWTNPKDLTFTREIIHVNSVESYVLKNPDKPSVVYAQVKNFQKDTTDSLTRAIRAAEEENPDLAGIILDLRNNPGGLLEQAITLSDGFLDDGTIVSTRGPERESNSSSEAKKGQPISTKPLVVLVNQGSASASEIVSGALKASRALLIGQKTFGKGSVQKLYPLTDGGALKLTVAQYLTPGEISIQSIGIEPDVNVYPAVVDEGNIRLGPPPNHVQEADLENSFKKWGNSHESSWAKLQFYAPSENDEEEGTEDFDEFSKEEKLDEINNDFEVNLARDILDNTNSGSKEKNPREQLIESAKAVIDRTRIEQNTKISEALANRGVDWSSGDSGGDVKLEVLIPSETVLKAGEKNKISITVKNVGSNPAFRVWGRTESDNPFVSNLDFAFGKINPGEEKTWSAEIETPESALDRWDSMSLSLKRLGSDEAGKGEGGVRMLSLPKPDFAYSYVLTDENPENSGKSGDGLLEEGERAILKVIITNRGEVAATAMEANLKGDDKEELYLEAARHHIETLGPGEKKEVEFSFKLLKPDEEGNATVGLSISDSDHGVFLSDALVFATKTPYAKNQDRIPPAFTFKASPPLRTSSESITIEAQVNDDEQVKDFYAYRDKKKISYKRNEGKAGLPLKLEVPLEEGTNRLILTARDNKDVMTTKVFYIHRMEQGEKSAELGMR